MTGMSISQAITMLIAAESQGATHVELVRTSAEGHLECAGIDWVSPRPVDGKAYITPLQTWVGLGNEAAESLDL